MRIRKNRVKVFIIFIFRATLCFLLRPRDKNNRVTTTTTLNMCAQRRIMVAVLVLLPHLFSFLSSAQNATMTGKSVDPNQVQDLGRLTTTNLLNKSNGPTSGPTMIPAGEIGRDHWFTFEGQDFEMIWPDNQTEPSIVYAETGKPISNETAAKIDAMPIIKNGENEMLCGGGDLNMRRTSLSCAHIGLCSLFLALPSLHVCVCVCVCVCLYIIRLTHTQNTHTQTKYHTIYARILSYA